MLLEEVNALQARRERLLLGHDLAVLFPHRNGETRAASHHDALDDGLPAIKEVVSQSLHPLAAYPLLYHKRLIHPRGNGWRAPPGRRQPSRQDFAEALLQFRCRRRRTPP